jgi:hypothetical protein
VVKIIPIVQLIFLQSLRRALRDEAQCELDFALASRAWRKGILSEASLWGPTLSTRAVALPWIAGSKGCSH